MEEITLGSLFDGIGGFPYAASFYGIRALWASEIVPECVSVTSRHFPGMDHVGDITRLHGGELAPVDIITFGSPCQGLSLAGLRRGLADERSGLFMEAVRIINEMKEATDGRYPKFALWENVPGALSSAGGRDYQAVLEAFTKGKVPVPGSGKWADAGMVRGGRADLAWVVYDAQHFGTAQRRRRVFLVADFTGGRAAEILFVPKSLRRYFEEGGTPRQGAAAFAEGGPGGTGREGRGGRLTGAVYCIAGNTIGRLPQNGGNGAGYQEGLSYTLTATDRHAVAAPRGMEVEILNDQGGSSLVVEKGGVSPTLRSQAHGNLPVVAVGINGSLAGPLVASYYKGTGERCGVERDVVLCAATGQSHAEILAGLSPTLNCCCEQPYVAYPDKDAFPGGRDGLMAVRRLTPLECERLQGFPDSWTAKGHDGRQISDSKRYQMLGNSIAVPCAAYIMQGIDQSAAIKTVKRKLTDLDKMKIEEQKKAVRSGYDMDIIPSDLATYGSEAKTLLEDLQSRNERMFLVTILIVNLAEKRQKLENAIFQAAGVAQKYNCALRRLDYQQEEGFVSSLPLGVNRVGIQRGLTTSSTAIFVPFTTQELFQDGEALYYGVNALSNNLIMCDRKKLKNPNGLILGTPGSGKSFSAKREIANAFLVTGDDIAIIDPEAEYVPLVTALGGQVIKVSPTSSQYINPMDINLNYSEEDDPLILKSDFILSLAELMMGRVEADEKSIIDQCLRRVYQKFFEDPVPEKMPILQDLYEEIGRYGGDRARHIMDCMGIYVTGSLNVFNHRTNVDIGSRIVCYDIKELGKQLKKLGMLVVQDQVWGRVTVNRESHRSTRLYIDEFHLLLKEEQTAAYSVEIWKRFRKWGGIPTGITQNSKDLLASREIENIFENSDFVYMLNQAAGDRQILARQLNISPHQLSYVTNSNAGEGLLFYGNVIIPFIDHFPKDTHLYKLLTTRPEDLA